MKKLKYWLIALAAILFFGGVSTAAHAATIVKVGVTSAKHEEWDAVKEKLAKKGINIQIVTFTDYVQPNNALAEGSLDLNAFQTNIYLQSYNKEHHTNLVPIAKTVIAPLGLYSDKITKISQIKKGATIAIPNDASNGGRALLLLQSAGLIKVDSSKGQYPTVKDITKNQKNLKIKELDANQTARALKDVDASVINSGMAVDAGINPKKDAIYLEKVNKKAEPYINVIAAQKKNRNKAVYKKVVKAFQSEDIAKVISKSSKGASIPVWNTKLK